MQPQDLSLPEQLDFGGYPEWLVARGALIEEATGVKPHPDDVLRIPMAWERAVNSYRKLKQFVESQNKPSVPDGGDKPAASAGGG